MSRLACALLSLVMAGCASTPSTPARSQSQSIPDSAAERLTDETLSFPEWVNAFRLYALTQGISPTTFDTAFKGVVVNPTITQSDNNQPEFERRIWTYIDGAASESRVQIGKQKLAQYNTLLSDIQTTYGVPPQFITAIWGLESSFGEVMGSIDIIEALATLAYRSRRSEFGRTQLIAALQIMEQGNATKQQMRGSWAGGMGHTQFIPTTYLNYGVDHNKDGRIDLWATLGDAFASTANYLSQSGWQRAENWGREVVLPKDFDYSLADKTIVKSIAQWQDYGVKAPAGQSLAADNNVVASMILPGGHTGPAFLIYKNFDAILEYNRSTAYALAIGHLADRLAGGGKIQGRWPVNEPPLSRQERQALQTALNTLGYEAGEVDGILGANTRASLRSFQRDHGLPADGFATKAVLARLLSEAGTAKSN